MSGMHDGGRDWLVGKLLHASDYTPDEAYRWARMVGHDAKSKRRAPKPYNGHHCWNCWNVALWINNDEGLYRFAVDCARQSDTASIAANLFLQTVSGKTPDGALYTFKAVRAAMVEKVRGE